MDAQVFLKAFQQVFVDQRQKAIDHYCSNKDFTDFVIDAINGIIDKHGYKTQKEYFRIDAIGWIPMAESVEKPKEVKLSRHLWDLEIAVEHENDQRDWMDEVVKLTHIVCPLRVVIGYLPWSKRKNGPEFDLLNLEHVVCQLKKMKCFDNMSRGEFLVIIGNCNTSEIPNRFFGYRGYLYDPQTQSFMPLGE